MSYPQPSSNASTQNGQGFFRLNTPLVSPGDIYESEVGALAFSVGPDSDLANIAIDYFDATQGPTFVNTVIISPQRTFVGQIAAANDRSYQPSGVPGRTLIRPTDLYNPTTADAGSLIGHPVDESTFIAPRLDVIQYFTAQPSLGPPRRDKEFYFQRLLRNNANNKVGVVMPYYGRKSGSWLFQNNNAQSVSFGLFAVNYTIGAAAGYTVKTIQAIAAVAAGTLVEGVLMESALGMFDALVAYADFTGVLTRGPTGLDIDLRIDVSDVPLSSTSP